MAQSQVLAHDPAIINIISVFDTKAILKVGKSTDPNKPVGLNHQNIYMIVNSGNLVSYQASGDLVVKAKVNDLIYWRAQSLTVNTADTVIFNNFVFDVEIIEKPRLVVTRPKIAVPDTKDPLKYKFETVPDVFYNSVVREIGQSAYKVYFYIVYENDSGAQAVSYYWWDPKVVVNDIN